MGQKKTPTKNDKKQRKNRMKKVSYIGAAALIFVGLIAATTHRQLSDISLSLDNTPIALPTYTPYQLPFSATSPTTAPSTAPEPTSSLDSDLVPEPAAVATASEPEPFRIIWPVSGDILKPFSADTLLRSKTMGDWRVHNGIDLAAERVSEVKAAADGVVEAAYEDPLMGFTIVITHPNGYQSYYQNLASTEMVAVGQAVTEGQVIAAVGHTAASELLDESHMHFSVKKDGVFLNPSDFILAEE